MKFLPVGRFEKDLIKSIGTIFENEKHLLF